MCNVSAYCCVSSSKFVLFPLFSINLSKQKCEARRNGSILSYTYCVQLLYLSKGNFGRDMLVSLVANYFTLTHE